MQLTLWTYEGPPHVGAMRVATAMTDVHYVLHAPQGDTYADLLFTMIERLPRRPPVTYTTFQARDLGGDTAELFKDAPEASVQRRSINPVRLSVQLVCANSTVGNPLDLGELKAGERYSVLLLPTASGPQLVPVTDTLSN